MTVWLYYRVGPGGSWGYWRTNAAAVPGRQVEFLNAWHDWEVSVLPIASDFIADADGAATPVPENEALQAALMRKAQEHRQPRPAGGNASPDI